MKRIKDTELLFLKTINKYMNLIANLETIKEETKTTGNYSRTQLQNVYTLSNVRVSTIVEEAKKLSRNTDILERLSLEVLDLIQECKTNLYKILEAEKEILFKTGVESNVMKPLTASGIKRKVKKFRSRMSEVHFSINSSKISEIEVGEIKDHLLAINLDIRQLNKDVNEVDLRELKSLVTKIYNSAFVSELNEKGLIDDIRDALEDTLKERDISVKG